MSTPGEGQQMPPSLSGASFKDAILGLTWALTIVSIAAVLTRLYFRKKYKVPISSDDWSMLIATVFQIVFQAFVTAACDAGLGNPLVTLKPEDILTTNKWSWISTPFSNVVSVVARISITILLVRIFGSTRRWYRWSMIALTGIVAVLGVTNVILIWAMCRPPESLWDKSIVGFRCLDSHIQRYLTLVLQVFFALSDVIYVALPVTFIYKLNMATHKKVGLAILLGLSLITGAAAFSKVVTNLVFSDVDPATRGDELFTLFGIMLLITSVEQSLVITIGCVPTLRPIALIRIPLLGSIRNTLASLLSSGSRRGSPSKGSSKQVGHSRDGYEDLELSNMYGTSKDRMVPPLSTSTVHAESGVDSIDTGKHIHRTHDYSITYADRQRATGNLL
ncbi:hypothetical protein ANO14919_120480 [Xylariales sp. No.14919]|nr:hypothetical protein ANO14919_120480 [Xylariales sp. No.14919]